MTNDRWQTIESIFNDAMNAAPEQRAELLDQRCGDDLELRREVEDLLSHFEQADEDFLQQPVFESPEITEEPDTAPDMPTEIGPYRILERLGAGGMGEVFLAEQEVPLKRRVALKLIKAGMDSQEVIARFESERQTLALMNHPNVAQIFDAGSTKTGRPYFAMEHVPGEPITAYCDRHCLHIRDRLELFISVCQAIHHAHQKGIIHRDIKPSNVLVAVDDDAPVPKVIDFGVAKAMQQSRTGNTAFTMQGVLVGTPGYMSPEQADMTGVNVDTASDVYSLGVLLYELLVGAQPFDESRLRSAGILEIHRIIRSVEPSKPSTRAKDLGQRGADLASKRRMESGRWRKSLRGELDWITMRALEKEPGRRYQSAHALAEDVERYLRNEPVLAGPPSQLYRLKKIVARRKLATAFVATVLAMVIGFGISMGVLRERAAAARDEARARAAELEEVTEFQASMLAGIDTEEMGQTLFADLRVRAGNALREKNDSDDEIDASLQEFAQTLAQINSTDVATDLVDEQVLRRAVQTLEERFADQPLVQAALNETVAETYRSIGRYSPALPLQRAAVTLRRRLMGDTDPLTLKSLNNLGDLYLLMGEHDSARTIYSEALENGRLALGKDHQETLRSMSNIADLHQTLEEYEEALTYRQAALDGRRRVLGDDHLETLISINDLGSLLTSMGRHDEAVEYFQEALEAQRRVLGPDHPETLNSINNLGVSFQYQGRREEALAHYREALDGRRRVLGDKHPRTLLSVMSLATLLMSMGQQEDALAHFEEAFAGRREALGKDHPKTLLAMSYIAFLLKRMGRLEESAEYYHEALVSLRRTRGDDHPETLKVINNYGALLQSMGKLDEAVIYLRQGLDANRRALGNQHPNTLQSAIILAGVLLEQGNAEESLSILEPAQKDARVAFQGNEEVGLGYFLARLGRSKTAMGQYSAAEGALIEAEQILNRTAGPHSGARKMALRSLSALYDAWHTTTPQGGYDEKAEQVRSTLAEI